MKSLGELMPVSHDLLTSFVGFQANQVPTAFLVLEDFLSKKNDIKRIIEIGTAFGGTTIFFGLHSWKNKGKTYTFDNNVRQESSWFDLAKLLGIEFIKLDVFSEEGINKIKELIQLDGITLLFCDGGNKQQEFNTFAPFLKSGDIIMAHDYRYEISLKSIESVLASLDFYFQEEFDLFKTRILCMVKK